MGDFTWIYPFQFSKKYYPNGALELESQDKSQLYWDKLFSFPNELYHHGLIIPLTQGWYNVEMT